MAKDAKKKSENGETLTGLLFLFLICIFKYIYNIIYWYIGRGDGHKAEDGVIIFMYINNI
jgi:hypothetical protein